ncbi:hypothetical protein PspLS_00126 [Pyricularia sp. CBS 133598]|nr:hypothetical protein PspLS_00126 [Pyricularia sp. CBS 133598]
MQLSNILRTATATLAFLPSGAVAACVIGLTYNGKWVPNNRLKLPKGGTVQFIAKYVIIDVRLDNHCKWKQDLGDKQVRVIIPSGYDIKSCDEEDYIDEECKERKGGVDGKI